MPQSKPLVFVSHKHADKEIAERVAHWVQDATDFNMDVFLSSHESFKGPRFGREINKELRTALWRCDALILVYTTEDREWSYCMWECGVANDAASPETTMIALQFSDDVPRVLAGTNLVDARKREDIRRFSTQFFTDPEFFPSLQGGAHKPNLPPDVIHAKADQLFDALKNRPDFSTRREWFTWPFVQVELPVADADKLKIIPRSDGIALVRDRAVVASCDPKALSVFGRANLAPGSPFRSLATAEGAINSSDWFDACCEQIVVCATDGLPQLSWASIRGGGREYVPAVSRVQHRPAEAKVLFDVYFYDLPPQGAEKVAERMLTPDRFFWKSLDRTRPGETRLAELNRELKAYAKNRAPFLSAQMQPRYIIHRSAITEYLADHGADEALTLEQFLADPSQRTLVEGSFATVRAEATLSEASRAMKQVAHCRDVFVTTDGTRDTAVQGWLTNVDLETPADAAVPSAVSLNFFLACRVAPSFSN